MYGHVGKILIADLSDKTYVIRDLDPEWARDFLGGPSLGARYLYELMPAKTPAFAPESVLGFVSGPVNGTKSLMGGRYTVVSKSPVTGGFNDANSGGNFGPYMKKSGFDAIFVKGISDEPVYLFVDDGKIEFRDATALWGKTTIDAENALKKEIGDDDICAAMIAPAGEHLSNMAAIMNDSHRSASRGGSGAVMGSKKLKAVVCRGTHTVPVRDPEEVVKVTRAWKAYAEGPTSRQDRKAWSTHGTSCIYERCYMLSDVGIKNWGGAPEDLDFETQIAPMSGQEMDKKYKVKKYACSTCQIGCGASYHVKSDKYDYETVRPEYEALGTFGSLLLNGDVESVLYCNHLCNEYGYDNISLGNTIAWLMECYENGLFTIDELDGIDLRWGNPDAIVEMTKRICEYKGIGVPLNGASAYASKYFDRGSEYLGVANGIEIAHHCARNNPAMARTFQFDPTPGRHVKGGRGARIGFSPPEIKYDFENTGPEDKAGTIKAEYDNLSGFCHFCFFLEPSAKYQYMNAVTGYDFTEEDFNNIGLRSFAIRSAFNLREGMRRKDYSISDRNIGIPPMDKGPLKGVTIPTKKLADSFYEAMGWDVETGVPTKEFLESVGGLEVVIKDLYPQEK